MSVDAGHFAAPHYRWAIQIAGCPVLFLSSHDAPTIDGSILSHEGGDYRTRPHCIGQESELVFARFFDLDHGVVNEGGVMIQLISNRQWPETCPFRHVGARGFREMEWQARLLADVDAETDTPDLVVQDIGQTIAEGDIIHIGPEAFLVDGVTNEGTYLTVATAARSVLGTDRISHRTTVGIDDVPYVTPRPVTWRGRRALIWRAPYHLASGVGRWQVVFRADIDTEAAVGTVGLAFKLISIAARTGIAVGATIRPIRLSRKKHVFAENVGCYLRVFAYARQAEMYQALVADDSDPGDPDDDIAVDYDVSGVGVPSGTERHAAVAAVAAGLPAGHPRTVPVRLPAELRAMNVTGYGVRNVEGVDLPTLETDATVLYPIARGQTIVNAEFAETVWLRLVDTSAGLVAVRPSRLIPMWNGSTIARARDLAPAGDIYGATFARIDAVVGADPGTRGSEVWRVVSKVAPHVRVTILLADSPRSLGGPGAAMLRRLNRSQSVQGRGWFDRTPHGFNSLEEWPQRSHQVSPLVWSWGTPEAVRAARRELSGTRDAEDAFQGHVGVQEVTLSARGQAVRVPRAPLPAAWYQSGERYLTLEGPTGVGPSGRLVLEVREGGSTDVIARCIAVGETEVEAGVWAVEIERTRQRDDFYLPTLVEESDFNGKVYTFTPAFVAEGAPAGETVAKLLTSGGGDGVFSTYDTEVFGARLRDGSGTIDTSVMGRDIDISGVLGLPSVAGARTSVIGRPGDKVADLVGGLIRGANYALDLVVRDNPVDPHDGCVLALRPIGIPSRAELRGTIGEHDIETGSLQLIDPGLRNVFEVEANHTADGPQIEIRATADTSIWAHGESRGRRIKLPGVFFDDVTEALGSLRPMLTRAVAEEAFPRDRYRMAVRSTLAGRMAVGDAWTLVHGAAPRSDGALGVNGAVRVIAIAHEAREAMSEIEVDYYGSPVGNRAPCCAVVDVISATEVQVAANFFASATDPYTGEAHTDLALLVDPAWGEDLGVGTPLRIYAAGDPDTKTPLVVESYDLATNRVVFTGAHGIADPGAPVDPVNYIAVLVPRVWAEAPAGHRQYFHHGRDAIT